MTRTKKTVALWALAVGMSAASAGPALADRNQTVAPPDRSTTVASAGQSEFVGSFPGQPDVAAEGHSRPDVAGKSVRVMARIPWDKSGRDKVPSCARHGTLNTSGATDHLKVVNRCSYSVTYHVILDRHSDHWQKVPSGYQWTASWKWPAKLHKIGT
ncbi:hypothetical protein [Streptomyces iranensis]|uniref:hypothetical protein n=1 Tax=Streptomyces iranensis TaxID=576784 RepID=UPI0039B74E1E